MPDIAPQLEDGYTRISNELLEAIIRHPFSRREFAIILAVIRKTYGFRKKFDDMTLTQLADATGIDLAHIHRTVRDLEAQNVLLKQQGKYGYLIGLSKNYRKWKRLPNQQPLAGSASDGCQKSKLRLPKEQPQKKDPKETTKGPLAAPTFWDVWVGIAGESKRSALGRLIRDHGEQAVAEAVAKVAIKRPADPTPYLIAMLNGHVEKVQVCYETH